MLSKASKFLEEQLGYPTVGVVEAGSRITSRSLASQEIYYGLKNKKIIGFEPDQEACDRLNKEALTGCHYYAIGLSDRNGREPLYITKDARSSSLFQPNSEFLIRFVGGDRLTLEKEISVVVTTIGDVLTREGGSRHHLIKADVQGAELKVLKGASTFLKEFCMIVVEVEFSYVYKDQPLAGDVSAFLTGEGFEFHHMVHTGGFLENKGVSTGVTRAMWGDAMYVKAPTHVSAAEWPAFAVLASLYDCHDLVVTALKAMKKNELIEEYLKKTFPDVQKREDQFSCRELLGLLRRKLIGR